MAMMMPIRLRLPRVATRAFQPTFFLAGVRDSPLAYSTYLTGKPRESVLTLPVHLDSSLNLLELVHDERVGLVTVRMVVCERAESLRLFALAHEVTGRLGHEPDEEELEDGGNGLEDGRNTP